MRSAAVLALLILAPLAGCLDDAGAPTLLSSASGKNIIQGVVADDALAPLQDVTVTLVATGATTATDRDGRFLFTRVPDGEHVLTARHDAYRPTAQRVAANGGEVRDVTFVLDALPDGPADVRTVEKRGYVSCGAAVRTGSHKDAANTAVTCGERDPNDQRELLFEVPLDEGVAGVVLELVWKPENPGARVFHFHTEQALDDGDDRELGGSEGFDGYASIVIPESVARTYFPDGGLLRTRTEPEGSFFDEESPTDAAIVVAQPFTVYATVFYNVPPPPGWTVLERDGGS